MLWLTVNHGSCYAIDVSTYAWAALSVSLQSCFYVEYIKIRLFSTIYLVAIAKSHYFEKYLGILVFCPFIYLAPCSYVRMTHAYSRHQLIDALQAEYIQLMHDVEPTEDDFAIDEHLDYLNAMSHADLVTETGTDDENPLSEFMYAYG